LSAEGSELEIGEHPHFERRWRIIQTMIFSVLALLVLAAVTGLFGSGPLTNRTSAFAGTAFTLHYPRFARARATADIVIEPRNASAGQVAVHLDRSLAEAMRIEKTSPSVITSGSDADGTLYIFMLAPGASGRIELQEKPGKPRLVRGRISVNGQAQSVTQIIWP
jgi:hypothetical protein